MLERNRSARHLLACATLALALAAACGSSSSGTIDRDAAPSPADTTSGDRGAQGPWATVPPGASEIDESALAMLADTGTLTEVTPEKRDQDRAAREKQLADDMATIDQLLTRRPELRDRLLPRFGAAARVLADGNLEVMVPGPSGPEPRTLQGGASRIHDIATAYRRFNTLDNQVAIFGALLPVLPDECAMGLPDQTAAMGMDALKDLNRTIAACVRQSALDGFGDPDPSTPPGQTTDPAQLEGASPDPQSSYFGDFSGNCNHKAGGKFLGNNWPTKKYDTPVKDQGRRGSCVSFAIASALENSIAHLLNRYTNLSEQALYAKAKIDWSPDDLEDGLSLSGTIADMSENAYAMPFESVWPYNRSPAREMCENGGPCGTDPEEIDLDYYRKSCVDKSGEAYGGPACSQTSHQAKIVCHQGSCYYWRPGKSSDGVYGVGLGFELSDIEDAESASFAMAFAQLGFSVTIGFDVKQSFQDLGSDGTWSGPLSDDDSLGSHAVHMSGAIISGQGGYAVIKNSWGTCFGDGGYAFMRLSGLSEVIHSATAIMPVALGNTPPEGAITSPSPGAHFQAGGINPPIHFSATLDDLEDGAGCCKVKWTSDKDGVIGTTASFDAYLSTPGAHLITLKITDSGGKKATRTITVTLDEQAPSATISFPVAGMQLVRNVPYVFQGSGNDPNDGPLPCTSLTWFSTQQGDPLNMQTGCAVQVAFATTGNRVITLRVKDSAGNHKDTNVSISVIDPPPMSPPTVSITQPPPGTEPSPTFISNPGATLSLSASVTDDLGEPLCTTGTTGCIQLAWQARTVGGSFMPVVGAAVGSTVRWTPSTQFPSSCGGYSIEVQLCATNASGTTCRNSFLYLSYPTC